MRLGARMYRRVANGSAMRWRQHCRLDLSEPEDKATVKRLISKLIKDGVLERVKMRDKKRNMRWYVKAKSSVYD